jgi:hypothetical protein
MPNRPNTPRPTLAEMRRAAPWLWLWCRNVYCRHKAPMALAPLIIRWGGAVSSDLLRQSARCRRCGSKGADLQHPSARSNDIGLAFHARPEDWRADQSIMTQLSIRARARVCPPGRPWSSPRSKMDFNEPLPFIVNNDRSPHGRMPVRSVPSRKITSSLLRFPHGFRVTS